MKRFLLICFFITISFSSYSQFSLTPAGFVIEGYESSEILEIRFDGMTQNELFKSASVFFNEVFEDNKGLEISNLRNESITLDGLVEDAIKWRKYGKQELYMDMVFTLTFKLANGKMLVSLPDIQEMFSGTLPGQLIKVKGYAAGGVYIYNKDGKLKYPIFKESLEDYFNHLIHAMIHYIDEHHHGDCDDDDRH